MAIGWVMAASAAASALGGVRGRRGASSQAKENAREHMRQAEEQARRMDLQQAQVQGQGQASVYASGIHMSGSSLNLLESNEEQYQIERQWMLDQAQREADAIKDGQDISNDASALNDVGAAIGAAGSIYSGYSNPGGNPGKNSKSKSQPTDTGNQQTGPGPNFWGLY
jgi:hypothetical protein